METMKYEIFVEDNEGYLVIRVSDPVTDDLLTELIRNVAGKASETGITNFLFDLRRAANQAHTATCWEVIHHLMKELGFTSLSKHALLVSPEHAAEYNLLDTLFFNAGYQSRTFLSEPEAIEWMAEKK